METVRRNFKAVCEAVGNGDVGTLGRKVLRSCEIVRQRNQLTDLEGALVRSVEKLAKTVC
jgi:hypothetical protein